MSLLIQRAAGDETAIKIKWNGEVDFSAVTAIAMEVWQEKSRQTLIETLVGEVRGFDPYTYFPVNDTSWVETRYFRFVLTIGTEPNDEAKPFASMGTWVNE